MRGAHSSARHALNLGVGDIAEVRDGDARLEPSPLLEQVERPAPVVFEGDLRVDLLVGLGAAPQPVLDRHLAQQRERLLGVRVDARWPHRNLEHAIARDAAVVPCGEQRADHVLRAPCSLFGLVPGASADEDEPGPQTLCGGGHGDGDRGAVGIARVMGPIEVMIRHRRDTAEEALGDSCGGGRPREIGVNAYRGIGGRHGGEPLAHRHASGAGKGAKPALEEVMVRVDQARRHDAPGNVEDLGARGGVARHRAATHCEIARGVE
ncbi:hypothetical protein GCM10025876_02130 [Demequina litorisediminis]|uniref:Uncharacterized protein n=1 Tax=Demequina litorisediminis TaxID=1849022 RepID=A0ABQ6I8Q7_9MICO|nr:hypothetical protein GCM10025876_02130 [Demequina litorisediminis]